MVKAQKSLANSHPDSDRTISRSLERLNTALARGSLTRTDIVRLTNQLTACVVIVQQISDASEHVELHHNDPGFDQDAATRQLAGFADPLDAALKTLCLEFDKLGA